MKVSQLANNQFKVYTKSGVVFQSYSSLVAYKSDGGEVYLSEFWDYSKTTLKYLKEFLGTREPSKVIRERIKKGEYKLIDERDLELLTEGYTNECKIR